MRPVIITGMGSSGTTHLWGVLSQDPKFNSCYCEPLHPNLPNEVEKDHYKAYTPELLGLHLPYFGEEDFVNDGLHNYISVLLSPGSLTKFIRLSKRMEWFCKKFPYVFIIVMVRDPRSVCVSLFEHANKELTIEGAATTLALWKHNMEVTFRALDKSLNPYTVVHYEDFCVFSEVCVDFIYRSLGRDIPIEVTTAYKEGFWGRFLKWQEPTNTNKVGAYEKLGDDFWKKALLVSKLNLEKYGYGGVK